MAFIKKFENFDESVDDIEDIFNGVLDCGLSVKDCFTGNNIDIKFKFAEYYNFKDITPAEFSNYDIGSFKSIVVRLDSNDFDFEIDIDVFKELEFSIKMMEDKFKVEFRYLYLRTPEGLWFKTPSVFKNWFVNLSDSQKRKLELVSYLDVIFKLDQ